MTEAELVQAWGHFFEISQSALAIYISVLSGYLAVAYLIGAKLTQLQVLVLSGLFTVFALFCAANVVVWWQRALEFAFEAKKVNPERLVSNNQAATSIMMVLLVLGVLASLYFMWSTRRHKPK